MKLRNVKELKTILKNNKNVNQNRFVQKKKKTKKREKEICLNFIDFVKSGKWENCEKFQFENRW